MEHPEGYFIEDGILRQRYPERPDTAFIAPIENFSVAWQVYVSHWSLPDHVLYDKALDLLQTRTNHQLVEACRSAVFPSSQNKQYQRGARQTLQAALDLLDERLTDE